MNSLQQITRMNHRWHDIVVDDRCPPAARAAITAARIVGGFPYEKFADDEIRLYVPSDEPDLDDKVAFARQAAVDRKLVSVGSHVWLSYF